ncbi:TPA: DUF3226 domain-containing protein [Enterobacter bugandensis]|uniref:DUF3226 domain-containing protein n=1 Tax=Enterobacter asburiae TaxID=61645 RepID=UPI00200613FA|nr:DUF3226 domain-containing protein [Enterobacter asburiae]MCK6659480.1 hypothetical protein [Enterobacter asburiae]
MVDNWLKRTKGPVILTEGDNDCHVIASLCQKYSVAESFGFYSCGSDDGAIKRLNALLLSSEIPKKIAIVLDADNPNLESKWARIKNIVERNTEDGSSPDRPERNGTIVKLKNNIHLGIWFMPDNIVDGMLEDFCIGIAPEQSIVEATAYVERCKDNNLSTHIDAHKSKAIIHAFLATQSEPGSPLGISITRNTLNHRHPSVNKFVDWLNRVFN